MLRICDVQKLSECILKYSKRINQLNKVSLSFHQCHAVRFAFLLMKNDFEENNRNKYLSCVG